MSESVLLPEASSPCGPCARLRLALYAAALAVLGSWVCFRHLDRGMLQCDEASFAYTSDRMVRTGDWVVPHIHELGPHLNAAPLYNWLTNLTAPLLGESNLRYRAWAAAFGVGCALAALALGAVLFRAEVGFVAGLLLLGNAQFVFVHGARWCVMESMLVCFVTAMAACYTRAAQLPGRAGVWWALVGLWLGLATLAKPPAMGGFFFCVLCAHHLLTRRDLAWRARLAGPLAAGLVAAAVALPWYAAILARLGPGAIQHLFFANSVGRAVNAAASSHGARTFYVEQIWQSSWGFKAALPALAWAAGCVLLGWNRRAWGLVLVLTAPFLLAISNAATKHVHYAYAAYPPLAVAAAGLLLAGLPSRLPAHPAARWACRLAAAAGVVATGVLLRHDLRAEKQALAAPRFAYPPLAIHRHAEGQLAAGRARLVLYRFPGGNERLDRKIGFTAHDRYYLDQMPHAIVVRDLPELNRLLADGVPAVVILPPLTPREEWLTGVEARPDRAAVVRSDVFAYPVLPFHGAEAKLGLARLFREIELTQPELAPRP